MTEIYSADGSQSSENLTHDVPLSAGARRVLLAIRESNLKARVPASPYLFPTDGRSEGRGARPGRWAKAFERLEEVTIVANEYEESAAGPERRRNSRDEALDH
jgi:hypothetical protein